MGGRIPGTMYLLTNSSVSGAGPASRVLRAIFASAVLAALGMASPPEHALEPGDLRAAGTIDFPVTGKPAIQAEFAHGVALLHSFFYEEARRVFTAVAEED